MFLYSNSILWVLYQFYVFKSPELKSKKKITIFSLYRVSPHHDMCFRQFLTTLLNEHQAGTSKKERSTILVFEGDVCLVTLLKPLKDLAINPFMYILIYIYYYRYNYFLQYTVLDKRWYTNIRKGVIKRKKEKKEKVIAEATCWKGEESRLSA